MINRFERFPYHKPPALPEVDDFDYFLIFYFDLENY